MLCLLYLSNFNIQEGAVISAAYVKVIGFTESGFET
jgi:hypothetical protein